MLLVFFFFFFFLGKVRRQHKYILTAQRNPTKGYKQRIKTITTIRNPPTAPIGFHQRIKLKPKKILLVKANFHSKQHFSCQTMHDLGLK